MRLIDADALEVALHNYLHAPHVQRSDSSISAGMRLGIAGCIDYLKCQPTVDAVEVVHGRWTAHKPDCRGYTAGFICSICGDIVYTDYSMKECIYNYCPNCGAKMDLTGVQNETD